MALHRVGAVVMGMLMVSCAGAAVAAQDSAVEIPDEPSQQRMLDLLQRQSLYRDRIDWPATRAQLQQAQHDPARVRSILDDVLARSSGGHAHWFSPRMQTLQATRAAGMRQAIAGAAATAPAGSSADGAAHTAQDPRIGWITVGSYASDRSADAATRARHDREASLRWQQVIAEQDDGARCGWVVDLRGNGGGNMWPMLRGLHSLLRSQVQGTETVGMFISGRTPLLWQVDVTGVLQNGQPAADPTLPVHTLRHVGAPVAVLVGPRTASSGEATMLAFRGRAHSRSFGQPTAGFSTGNRPVQLDDGSMFLLTANLMADRAGNGDGARLAPDVALANEAEVAAAARTWLLQQPACARHAALTHAR